jgi:hypothetical protein
VHDYLLLAASTTMYGMGVVAQSVVARRAERPAGAGLGLLARLAKDRLYLIGLTGQAGGFTLAFFARASLPLYLVQAGSSCAIGLATVFGVLVLGWRVRFVEVVILFVMATGLVLLALAAEPSVAHDIPPELLFALLVLSLLIGVAASRACRMNAIVSLAVLAGLAFGVIAIGSRSLAAGPILELLLQPVAWLMLPAALLGQACLSVALTSGSVASTVASMDATTMVFTSLVGIVLLGDRIASGRQWSVVLGLTLVLLAVLALGWRSRLASAMTVRPAREPV